MLKMLRPYLSQFVKNSKIFWALEKKYFFRNPKILGRHACLGAEVLGRLQGGANSVNFQKNRVDHVNRFKSRNLKLIKEEDLREIIVREPIKYCVRRQSKDFHEMREFDFLIIDSFSELADQAFLFDGNGFYSCYSDITEKARANSKLESLGLLSVDRIEDEYRTFFTNVSRQSPKGKIIYLHFPMIKEKREHFLLRAKNIKLALETLENEFENLYVYSLDNNEADSLNSNDDDNFSYHYDSPVYEEFVRLIVKDFTELKRIA
ncbi:Uncharacterised protein [Serratia fonticola]|uniref:hypothetical protein n=1 Tax=Serratia fonticola TaxID=47917 RepID=UPI00217A1C01|nr:hypothetical protein [Serratia fonticola]CAI1853352.1 Uncharacterised protein [Serratia fonticola]